MSSLSAARVRVSVPYISFTSLEGAVVVFALSTTQWRSKCRLAEKLRKFLKKDVSLQQKLERDVEI